MHFVCRCFWFTIKYCWQLCFPLFRNVFITLFINVFFLILSYVLRNVSFSASVCVCYKFLYVLNSRNEFVHGMQIATPLPQKVTLGVGLLTISLFWLWMAPIKSRKQQKVEPSLGQEQKTPCQYLTDYTTMDIEYYWRDKVDEDWKSLATIVINECTSFRIYKPEYKR